MTKQTYKNDLSEAIHSSAKALHKVGAMDKETMRRFDQSCPVQPPVLAPLEIKTLR